MESNRSHQNCFLIEFCADSAVGKKIAPDSLSRQYNVCNLVVHVAKVET